MADRSRVQRIQVLVLRGREYGDADRILTVLTPHSGKLDLIAKGIRKITSRKAGHLELFTHASVVVAKARTWDIITEASTVEGFRNLRLNLDSISQASYASELVDVFGEAADDSQHLWNLLLLVLRELDEEVVMPDLLLRWYELHLLSLGGFQPQLFYCLGCRKEIEPEQNYLSLAAGGVYCPRCGGAAGNGEERSSHPQMRESISVEVLKVLRHLQRSSWGAVRHLQIDQNILGAMENILYRYLVIVLERELKSVDFVRRLQRFGQAA